MRRWTNSVRGDRSTKDATLDRSGASGEEQAMATGMARVTGVSAGAAQSQSQSPRRQRSPSVNPRSERPGDLAGEERIFDEVRIKDRLFLLTHHPLVE